MCSDSIFSYTLTKKVAINFQVVGTHFATNMKKKNEARREEK